MLVTEHVLNLHKKFDGICQKCGQRCDKSVVSVVRKENFEIIVCPDCVVGKTKITIQISDQLVLELLKILPDYTFNDLKSMLLSFPHQFAIVHYHPNFRVYWSWDKSQPVKTILTNHHNQIKGITFHKHEINKKFRDQNKNNINGTQYHSVGQSIVPINRVVISDVFQNTTPSREKIEKQMNYYRMHGHFRGIKVERIGSMQWSLLDGYSRYCAANQLGLTHFLTEELSRKEEQHPNNHGDNTFFLTYTSIRKSKSSQEHTLEISLHRWRDAKLKKKFLLNFGAFSNYEDGLLAVNMIRHSLNNEEHFSQLEELKLPRLSVSFTKNTIMIKYGHKKTITQNIGLWSESNFNQLTNELNNCLENPIIT